MLYKHKKSKKKENAMKNSNLTLILTAAASLLISYPATAETIFEAMTAAYNTNPTLHGQRASSGATNEDAALARSGFLPSVSVGASYTDSHSHTVGNPTRDGYSKGYNGSVQQSLFSGGQTYNGVKAADHRAKAGIAYLYAVEQEVLLNASKAYLDVVRDEAIVKLQKNNENLLKKQLDETMARYNVGEVTRTDVAQSRASYAQAQSELVSAEGNLAISRDTYMRVVGKLPQDVHFPKNLQTYFPTDENEAMKYALANNYSLIAAKKSLKAAKYNVKSKEGALLPEVTFRATTGRNKTSTFTGRDPSTYSTEYTVNMSVPLYSGGATRANIRKSKYQRWEAQELLREAEREVVSGVTGSWATMQANKSSIASISEQVKASAIALEGTQKEESLGNRTVLDVLNAYQTLLISRVNEVKARHDYYVSGLNLLQSMGKLTAKKLGLNVNYYDAEATYRNTRGKWLSLSIDD